MFTFFVIFGVQRVSRPKLWFWPWFCFRGYRKNRVFLLIFCIPGTKPLLGTWFFKKKKVRSQISSFVRFREEQVRGGESCPYREWSPERTFSPGFGHMAKSRAICPSWRGTSALSKTPPYPPVFQNKCFFGKIELETFFWHFSAASRTIVSLRMTKKHKKVQFLL